MKTKNLTAAASVLLLSMSFAPAAFACSPDGTGCEEDPDPPAEDTKGNNGWGNGSDMVGGVVGSGTNSGSFTGKTKDSKQVDGTGVDKFDAKFTDGR